MVKLLSIMLTLFTGASALYAQSTSSGTTTTDTLQRHNDSVILSDVILPLVQNASKTRETPDWPTLGQDIRTKYGDSYVDRTVTKAKIYYYYGKDWPLFSQALVHYTEAYEDKEDLKLMNKNAKMVLQYSQNTDELKAALVWIKHAVDKEPGNAAYKDTYDGLAMKIRTGMPKS
ncbi:MAG TPA: hypothetical protein VHC96_23615 [Puia sp.]|nr:hypothetical protein [Puia sp.]